MERLISDEERLRRAEDVIERRKNTNLRISGENFYKEKSNQKVRKMLLQILICLVLYCGFYYIKNSTNEYKNYFIDNVNTILKNDTDFKKVYIFLEDKFKKINIETDVDEYNNVNDSDEVDKGENDEEQVNNVDNESEITIEEIDMGIGGEFVE